MTQPTEKVIVTGAAGFIGSNLVKRLLTEGFFVIGIDDLSNGHVEFLPEDENFQFIQESINGPKSRAVATDLNVTHIFHLAAVPRVSYSVEHPLETNDVNVSQTLSFIESARENTSLKRFVFASSSSVYGGANVLPTNTSYPKDPKSPYALQKSIIEDYLKMYYELYGFESVCLRFFNVFGPNQLGDSPYATAVSAWLDAIFRGKPMRSDGDGTQSRDMCHVDNVVEACYRTTQYEDSLESRRFNVACGESVTNNEILERLQELYPDAQKVDAPWRPGDVMHTLADISDTQNVLGYQPVATFWEGFDQTVQWFEDNWDDIENMELNT
jgi:nucleoside-diphosphate-sugar epimerase